MWIIMNICYLCKEVLFKENESVEHIIPNSIGGRLKSKKLLCKKCNSKLGTEYDSEVSKMYNLSMIVSGIKKDRIKKDRNKKFKTEKLYWEDFHNIRFCIERNKKGIKINPNNIFNDGNNIFISGINEYVKEKEELLKSGTLKNKVLKINDKTSLNMEDKIYLKREDKIDNEKLFKSVLKTGIGFYLEKGNNIEKVEDVRKILSQENNFENLENIVKVKRLRRKTNYNYHSLWLFKNPITSKVNCYIFYHSQFFNHYFKVELSREYKKNKFEFDFYLFNLTINQEEVRFYNFQYKTQKLLNKGLEEEKNNPEELNRIGNETEELTIGMFFDGK